MPTLWRYLITQYLKVLLLSLVAFVAILLTTRLEEIAHFAALGAEGKYVLFFTLYQIPYILPIALPISALISAVVLMQMLSKNCELTALRASGIPIRHVLIPILLTAGLLSVANFYVVSEMATESHLVTRLLKRELKSINPLLLLQNTHLIKLKGLYVNVLGRSKSGESATDVVVSMVNPQTQRLNVMIAKKLFTGEQAIVGKKVSLISTLVGGESQSADPLFIENIGIASTPSQDFTQLLKNEGWRVNSDHLKMPMLLVRIGEEKAALAQAKKTGEPLGSVKKRLHRSYAEVLRRFSLTFAVFAFTLMGLAFGISVGRTPMPRKLLTVVSLSAFYLVSFFIAKGMDEMLFLTGVLYLVPLLVMVGLSIRAIHRLSVGIS
jgi:lipopolysaccharide export system permease protein